MLKIILCIIIFVFLFVLFPLYFTLKIIFPQQIPFVAIPPDDFKKIEIYNLKKQFNFNKVLKLSCLIKHNTFENIIIIVHGFGDNKYSYIDIANSFFNKGFSVFLLDLRNHGESDNSYTSLGIYEKYDILAAIEYLKKNNYKNIYLYGVSMGGVSCLLTAAISDNVKKIAIEGAFDSFYNTIIHHGKLFYGLPEFPFGKLTLFYYKLITKVDFNKGNAVALAKSIKIPVLLIYGKEDRRVPIDIGYKYKKVIENSKLVEVADAHHSEARETLGPSNYDRIISDFFLPSSPTK